MESKLDYPHEEIAEMQKRIKELEDAIEAIAGELFEQRDNGKYYNNAFTNMARLAKLVNKTLGRNGNNGIR